MLPGQQFLTADDVHVGKARQAKMLIPSSSAAAIPARLWWQRDDVPFFLPSETATDAPVAVEVNHGRWIIACECGGAQLASRDDRRFFCIACLNEKQGGMWRPVTWPKKRDADEIEAQLRPRLTENANWLPGESVADLVAENEKNGVS